MVYPSQSVSHHSTKTNGCTIKNTTLTNYITTKETLTTLTVSTGIYSKLGNRYTNSYSAKRQRNEHETITYDTPNKHPKQTRQCAHFLHTRCCITRGPPPHLQIVNYKNHTI